MTYRLLIILIFFLFLVNGFFIEIGFRAIPLYFVCLPIFLFFLLLRKFNKLSFNLIEKSLLCFYFFCMVSSIYSSSYELSFRFTLGLVLIIMCYILAKSLAKNVSDVPMLFRCAFSLFLYSSFFYYLLGFSAVDYKSEHTDFFGLTIEKGIPRFIGLNNDPNISAVALMFPFFFFMFDKSRFSKVTLLITTFCIIATLSRGGVVSVLFALATLLVVSKPKNKLLIGFSFLLGAVISLFIYLMFIESLQPILEKRLTGASTGGGRFEVWNNALDLFELRPMLGHGIFTFRYVSDINFDVAKFAHNTYLEIMVETGAVGLILFFVFCFSVLLQSFLLFVQRSECRFLFPLTVAVFFSMLSLSLYINPIFIFLVLINSIYLYFHKRGNFAS